MRIQLFDDLLSKQMTRKEFILHIGLLLFVLTGISGLLKTLSDPYLTSKKAQKGLSRGEAVRGFGSGPYGV